jgi:hypothetical protein
MCAVWIISILLIILFLIALSATFKQSINNKEFYGGNNTSNCNNSFPPSTGISDKPLAALNSPLMTSHNNPTNVKPSDKLNATTNLPTYSDKFVCNTPWNMNCVTNDSCAQFGIGESCQGPQGQQFCVCQTKHNDGITKLSKPTPYTENMIIDLGGVCTQDNQCISGYCKDIYGQFSKMCSCPDNTQFDEQSKKCILIPQSVPDISPPAGSCTTSGKSCKANSQCSLGEACTPDGFCACQLVRPGRAEENKVSVGGNCAMDTQCVKSAICKNNNGSKTCQCPPQFVYDWSTNTCKCPMNGDVWDSIQKKCVPPQELKRTLCPTSTSFQCASNAQCGLGEYCDMVTQKCVCTMNTYLSGYIEMGGKCDSDRQCSSGKCVQNGGAKICAPSNDISTYSLAITDYSF